MASYASLMEPSSLDSLTPSERNVLRHLLLERDQKSIARLLGLSPETVKTHLRNAREKCRADTSFAVAKALALHEAHPPSRGMPLRGVGSGGWSEASEVQPAPQEAVERQLDEVGEARTPFTFDHDDPLQTPATHREGTSASGHQRLLMVVATVLILMLVIILAFPLSESFQRLANVIDPPTR